MVFDPCSVGDHSPVPIHGKNIGQVSSYKNFGVHPDDKFSCEIHTDNLCSCLQQRLFFFFYVGWGCLALTNRLCFYFIRLYRRDSRQVQTAMRVIGRTGNPSLQAIYEQSFLGQAQRALSDSLHILYFEYELLPSGRWYWVLKCKLNRFF